MKATKEQATGIGISRHIILRTVLFSTSDTIAARDIRRLCSAPCGAACLSIWRHPLACPYTVQVGDGSDRDLTGRSRAGGVVVVAVGGLSRMASENRSLSR